jgi:hypothetical protein
MLSLAQELASELVARAARFIVTAGDTSGLWVVSVRNRVVGSLVCEAGEWRLAWFEEVDPRLANYTGVVDGDVDALAETLSLRLGAPVRLESLSS